MDLADIDHGLMRAEEAVTWLAIACAGFAVSFFAGTAVLRYMWNRQNA